MPPLNSFSRSCLAIAIGQSLGAPLQAAEIVVNTTSDVSAPGGNCTLREAIITAETNPGDMANGCVSGELAVADSIVFDDSVFPATSSNTISLGSALPAITSDLTISGPGATAVTVDGNSYGSVLTLQSANVSLQGLTIKGGLADYGGGIYVYQSSLTLTAASVTGNTSNGEGGGIYALGSTLTVTDSSITANQANYGGGVYASGMSSLDISDSEVSGNTAQSDGAGIYARGTTSVNLQNSTMMGNYAVNNGGGIYALDSSTVDIGHSTVSANSAYFGGGLYAYRTSVFNVTNSTISNNMAIYGGGLYLRDSSSASIINSTVATNLAYYGGGIFSLSGNSFNLANSIIGGNVAFYGAEVYDNDADSTFSTSNNLFGDSTNSDADAFVNFLPAASDITATSDGTRSTGLSAILQPLEDNGGNTLTHALTAGSPAIDAGNPGVCAAAPVNNVDQRFEIRPMGAACDIGAYEARDDGFFFVIPIANGKAVVIML